MLETARLLVVPVTLEHVPAQLAYYERNKAHLAPWDPTWPSDFLTAAYWQLAARRAQHDARDDIARGVFSAAHIGYSVDVNAQGKGIGGEAVGAVVDFAFTTLRLHRVMANYQPTNERSARLLRRLGFVPEGFGRDYLYIAGAWRDHILTAKNNPDQAYVPDSMR